MSGYIGPIPVPQGIQEKETFTATSGQTTFNTNGYTDGAFINVFLNGVRLVNGTDYTATNGSDVVLASGANAGDVLDFETFNSFSLVDQTFDNVTLKNPTHEDTDGGRESAVSFKGEQSGGEISTLAQIQASHDGTADDQKGDLIFKTNDGSDNNAPTERLRISSAGEFQLGGTTNAGFIDFDGTSLQLNTQRNPNTGAFVNTGRSHASIALNGSNADSSVRFYTKDSNNATASERWRITKDGHFKAISDGLGIDFSASEGSGVGTDGSILDDYEEGTFTPATADGIALNSASGIYRKIGKVVHVGMKFTIASNSNSSAATITSLPFTVANDDSARAGLVISWNSNGQGNAGLDFLLVENTTTGIFYLDGSSKSYSALSSDTIYLGGTYPVA